MFIRRNIGMEKPLITITCVFTLNTYLYCEGVFKEFDNSFTKIMTRKLYKWFIKDKKSNNIVLGNLINLNLKYQK